ncbi:GlxA family transcriptional regulator [Marinobacter sp. JSM 1782161]|uniref:GlxA family transcriptional regulator n=1 Tax=Marinobacter sp. JSM 1782161 TaxID=2685906 RepID=UPI001403B55E|nr:helix-turn-helix domain-containing protein [Marinobacter sp. JSM 1782161]
MSLNVGLLLLPGASALTYAAAVEPLLAANRLLGETCFAIHHFGVGGALGAGLPLPQTALQDDDTPLHWLLVIGGHAPPRSLQDSLPDQLRARAPALKLIGGLASGSLVLAEAGLLDGYRAALHGLPAAERRRRYAGIRQSDDVFCVDRNRVTCRGATAAQDLMIWTIGRELGRDVAEALAQWFVRERVGEPDLGGGTELDQATRQEQPALAEAVDLMFANIEEPLSGDDIAGHVNLSRRQLERLFRKHLDTVPSRYYLKLRLDRARELVRNSGLSLTEIALSCGFSSGAHFSTTYRNAFGLTPSEDREV